MNGMDMDLFQSFNGLNLPTLLCDVLYIKNSPYQTSIKTAIALWRVEFFSNLAHASL